MCMNGSWVSQFILYSYSWLRTIPTMHSGETTFPRRVKDKQKNIDPPNSQPISQKLEKTFNARSATWETKMSATANVKKKKRIFCLE